MKRFLVHLGGVVLGIAFMVIGWDHVVLSQNVGSPAPFVPQTYLDENGNPLASGTVSTYITNSSNSQVTYSDAALNTRNANPVVLDSAGRATIFLSATVSYRFVIANSANAGIVTRDDVRSAGWIAEQSTLNISQCDGRMSTISGVPVSWTDDFAANTIVFTPYRGNRCHLYDGTDWRLVTFSELSVSLGTDAANTNYDLFLYLAGSVATLERVAWTNDYDRTTNLTYQNGILVRSGATTRRYLGTYRTTNTIGQTEDSEVRRFVWNHQHKVRRSLRLITDANSWNYSANNWRQSGGIATHQVAGVVGWTESVASLQLKGAASSTVAQGGVFYLGIGYRTTGVPSQSGHFARIPILTSNAFDGIFQGNASWNGLPGLGANSWVWLEQTAGALPNITFYGDNTDPINFQGGLIGWIEG